MLSAVAEKGSNKGVWSDESEILEPYKVIEEGDDFIGMKAGLMEGTIRYEK